MPILDVFLLELQKKKNEFRCLRVFVTLSFAFILFHNKLVKLLSFDFSSLMFCVCVRIKRKVALKVHKHHSNVTALFINRNTHCFIFQLGFNHFIFFFVIKSASYPIFIYFHGVTKLEKLFQVFSGNYRDYICFY